MANTQCEFKELRVILEPELTQVYILIHVINDDMGPASPQGWHHKTFPASKPTVDILNSLGEDSPLLWPHKAP